MEERQKKTGKKAPKKRPAGKRTENQSGEKQARARQSGGKQARACQSGEKQAKARQSGEKRARERRSEGKQTKGRETTAAVGAYRDWLLESERSRATVEKYTRDLRRFLCYLEGRPLSKERVIAYKEELQRSYAVTSVNSMLAAVNGFLDYAGRPECRVKPLRLQHRMYCPQEKELSKEEYYRLLEAAREAGKERLWLILQTVCGTGIRISELEYITVKSVRCGLAQVEGKGKCRQVFLCRKLRRILNEYIKREKLAAGPVFVSVHGKPLNRSNLWREMKKLCAGAGIPAQKVFPHNLRHLFAATYYQKEKDMAKLADLLGHSSINTTRIYILSSGLEHREQVEKMELVL